MQLAFTSATVSRARTEGDIPVLMHEVPRPEGLICAEAAEDMTRPVQHEPPGYAIGRVLRSGWICIVRQPGDCPLVA